MKILYFEPLKKYQRTVEIYLQKNHCKFTKTGDTYKIPYSYGMPAMYIKSNWRIKNEIYRSNKQQY